MTTPRPDDIFRIGNIRDVASLKLIGRVLEGQITMLESQRVQLEELHSNIEEQIANIDKRG